jgi:hypothetical protein
MRRTWGGLLALLIAGSSFGCTSGDWFDHPQGMNFLPTILQTDSGSLALTSGVLATGGDIPSAGALPSVGLQDGTTIFTAADNTDTTGDGKPDYIVVTLRPLSMEAVETMIADVYPDPAAGEYKFYKVGGLSLLPLDATFSSAVTVNVPVHTAADPTVGTIFSLYEFTGGLTGRQASAVDAASGYWHRLGTVTVSTDGMVSFTTYNFGQFAIISTTATPPAA